MTKKYSFRALSLAVVFLLALSAVAVVLAATITVDDFNTGDQQICLGGTSSFCTAFSVPDASSIATTGSTLGGERDIRLLNYAGGAGNQVFLRAANSGNTVLDLSQDTGASALAEITWDGADGDPTVVSYGLSADLTDGGSNDLFVFVTTFNDLSMNVDLRVYCNATDWSYATFSMPGGVLSGDQVDLLVPFTDFVTGGGVGCAPQNTNVTPAAAVQLLIDGSLNSGADLNLDNVSTDSVRDHGDLPASYGDASHISNGLRLGSNVDTESAALSSANADGDDLNGAGDEDGVTRNTADYWTPGNTVSVDVVVNGCSSGTCYLNGWIDWGNDGTMDAGDVVFSDQSVANGTNTLSITVPASGYTTGTALYARFRVCDSAGVCNAATGDVATGEVEDYFWQFGPTAITLSSLSAQSGGASLLLVLGAAAFVLLAGAGLMLRKRYTA